MPTYRTDSGAEFTIAGIATAECPVSLITPRSQELLQMYIRAKRVKEASGAALFGPDQSEWPAWAVDAVDVCELESIRHENAKIEAETRPVNG